MKVTSQLLRFEIAWRAALLLAAAVAFVVASVVR